MCMVEVKKKTQREAPLNLMRLLAASNGRPGRRAPGWRRLLLVEESPDRPLRLGLKNNSGRKRKEGGRKRTDRPKGDGIKRAGWEPSPFSSVSTARWRESPPPPPFSLLGSWQDRGGGKQRHSYAGHPEDAEASLRIFWSAFGSPP